MPRFLLMLTKGFKERGHTIEVVEPRARFYNLPVPFKFKKWLGYIDQFLVFPLEVRHRLKKYPADTLFVFTDHALGPWVPIVAHKNHVIHCHDFLAQRSALGEVKENKTGWSGQQYQAFIKRGYAKGKNFLSVSERTKRDLHSFLKIPPLVSEVVYNGLNYPFKVIDPSTAKTALSLTTGIDLAEGYIMHVGGNQWYKNREGVIHIYNAWRLSSNKRLPLLLIGEPPGKALIDLIELSPYFSDIHCVTGLNNQEVNNAYSGATVLLFPSLAEGFGWPIAEAMACGCPVITTNENPMTEVAGDAALLIPRMPADIKGKQNNWVSEGAVAIEKIATLPEPCRKVLIEKGLINVKRFDPNITLSDIEKIYKSIVESS